MVKSGGHPFCEKLNALLRKHGFDERIERECARDYPEKHTQTSPGSFGGFRLVPGDAQVHRKRYSKRSARPRSTSCSPCLHHPPRHRIPSSGTGPFPRDNHPVRCRGPTLPRPTPRTDLCHRLLAPIRSLACFCSPFILSHPNITSNPPLEQFLICSTFTRATLLSLNSTQSHVYMLC